MCLPTAIGTATQELQVTHNPAVRVGSYSGMSFLLFPDFVGAESHQKLGVPMVRSVYTLYVYTRSVHTHIAHCIYYTLVVERTCKYNTSYVDVTVEVNIIQT